MKIWKIYANRDTAFERYKWHSSAETFDVRQRICHFRQLILEHDTKIIIHSFADTAIMKIIKIKYSGNTANIGVNYES